MPKKKRISERLIQNLKTGFRHAKLSEKPFYCWQIDELKLKYTDDQRKKLSEAQDLHYKAQNLVKEVYAELIGAEVVKENT